MTLLDVISFRIVKTDERDWLCLHLLYRNASQNYPYKIIGKEKKAFKTNDFNKGGAKEVIF